MSRGGGRQAARGCLWWEDGEGREGQQLYAKQAFMGDTAPGFAFRKQGGSGCSEMDRMETWVQT